jgi:hypothetical protein
MVYPGTSPIAAGRGTPVMRLLCLWLIVFLATIFTARAAIRFDVFAGYGVEHIVPQATWFPITCEIMNDGAAFVGTIEITSANSSEGQVRRLTVELPPGTLKRVFIPVFSSARYQRSWNVRLLDERGKLRAEQSGVGPNPGRQLSAIATVIGAFPRTAAGMPVIRPIRANQNDVQPALVRLDPAYLSDNPVVYEGMDAIYLNSERATGLDGNQVEALLTWVNGGGHLIVAVEQISDVNGINWLRKILPCDLTDIRPVKNHEGLQEWLRALLVANDKVPGASSTLRRSRSVRGSSGSRSAANPFADAPVDPDFENNEMSVAIGTPRNGEVLAAAGEIPLMVTSHLGEGRVTALLFSPEREPFRSWKNLQSFWSKLFEIPPELYFGGNLNNQMSFSIDGVFGAMVDSKQIRKLPVEWLLLLLLVYLLVIGPVDQYWLKRIRRPMLTWITFPCYVVMFSLMIYFIGYKLRAGETEWNELHLVDVLQKGEGAELRGRTYASIYSPINATYKVEGQERFATFRGEFQNPLFGGGAQDSERAEINQTGDNFKGSIFVPVWTSQLYMSDWWQPSPLPLSVTVAADDKNWVVTVNNHRDRPLNDARIVIEDRMMSLGNLAAGQIKKFTLPRGEGTSLPEFVRSHAGAFQNASNQRQRAFGDTRGGRIYELTNSCMAVSFISRMDGEQFVTPPGLDLSPLLDRGNAVLLAWESDFAPVKPMNQFPTRRGRKDTLWRMSVPITTAAL